MTDKPQNDSVPNGLDLLIAQQKSILLVTMVGSLIHENSAALEQGVAQIKEKEANWVVLHLRDLSPEMDRSLVSPFAQLQKSIRDKPARLLIAAVHPKLKAYLVEHGVLRTDEVVQNVKEALDLIITTENLKKIVSA